MNSPELLSESPVKRLETLLGETDNPQVRQRIIMLLLRHEGKTYGEISKTLGCSIRTVAYWCTHACPDSPDSFRDKRQEGNRQKVTEEYVELLQRAINKLPSELGLEWKKWTTAKLAEYLFERTGIQLSGEQVRRLLKKIN
jgi:transposase